MAERVHPQATIEYLQSWEEHGATWRAVELGDEQVVVELCTCYGEPMDVVASRDPSVIEFVRRHGEDQRS
jgi:hypothetical protein